MSLFTKASRAMKSLTLQLPLASRGDQAFSPGSDLCKLYDLSYFQYSKSSSQDKSPAGEMDTTKSLLSRWSAEIDGVADIKGAAGCPNGHLLTPNSLGLNLRLTTLSGANCIYCV